MITQPSGFHIAVIASRRNDFELSQEFACGKAAVLHRAVVAEEVADRLRLLERDLLIEKHHYDSVCEPLCRIFIVGAFFMRRAYQLRRH